MSIRNTQDTQGDILDWFQCDPGNGDAGGNGLQNFPVVTIAQSNGSSRTHLEGTLASASNRDYSLEFIANTACDPSGNGEGQLFVGTAAVRTNAGGNATFVVDLPTGVAVGSYITATTTDANGNTSEFSACRVVAQLPSPPGDINGDGVVNAVDRDLFVRVLRKNRNST